MAKKRLHTETDVDFLLWGVLSAAGGHRICWELNKYLELALTRQEDVLIERRPTNEDLFFNFYSFSDPINFFKIELIKNKSGGEFYLKELKNFDFLLMVKGELDFFETDAFTNMLKKLPSIQSAMDIDLQKIKNISQLILE